MLVNITASSGLKMREYHEVMGTIKEFTAEDATVIVGTVIDDEMDDRLRVTMIATGLGGAGRRPSAPRSSRCSRPPRSCSAPARTATACASSRSTTTSSTSRRWSVAATAAPIAGASAFDVSEIPAFLRKQAD